MPLSKYKPARPELKQDIVVDTTMPFRGLYNPTTNIIKINPDAIDRQDFYSKKLTSLEGRKLVVEHEAAHADLEHAVFSFKDRIVAELAAELHASPSLALDAPEFEDLLHVMLEHINYYKGTRGLRKAFIAAVDSVNKHRRATGMLQLPRERLLRLFDKSILPNMIEYRKESKKEGWPSRYEYLKRSDYLRE